MVRCTDVVEKTVNSLKGDEQLGAEIVLRALSAPMKQIVDNGGKDGSVVVDEILEKPTNTGYNANSGKYVDMFQAGIVDRIVRQGERPGCDVLPSIKERLR